MEELTISRRALIGAAAGIAQMRGSAQQEKVRLPLKIGHRAASMKMVGNLDVFKFASRIPGLMGVELQVTAGSPNLWDLETVLHNKKEANRWGMHVPSVAGVWARGVSIKDSEPARANLLKAIRAAELLGASVILAAFFRNNAPDMNDESSYGPVVKLMQETAPAARDVGVILGLENSLSPADNRKLVDLIAHDHVKVFYDVDNVEFYGHKGQAVPGIKLLGKERICQVHVKNGPKLIEQPGRVDWKAAFAALNEIGYEGWYVFESSHSSPEQCIEATTRNIAFLKQQIRMPLG
jgi:L-ribulose-5-phosphate 3-epimerase